MQDKQIKIGVVGGTGYTGMELLRLLSGHPSARISVITSRSEAGRDVSELFPSLRGILAQPFIAPDVAALKECHLVFFATPNGVAMEQAPVLLDAGVKVIDLAADFRLKDEKQWQYWYGRPHACPQWLSKAVYGLPELHRQQIAAARLVANPGCYPTAVQLGFRPLIETGLADLSMLIADTKSGASGAGRNARTDLLLTEVSENFRAYAASGHRHWPEITQGLEQMAQGDPVSLTFTPHLVPMARGIHATLYVSVEDTEADLQAVFEDHYQHESFVDVLPAGSHPETATVRGTNICRLAVHRSPGSQRAVVLSVIDNLVKGAAGQAIQNMNIMFGLDESTGLTQPALCP